MKKSFSLLIILLLASVLTSTAAVRKTRVTRVVKKRPVATMTRITPQKLVPYTITGQVIGKAEGKKIYLAKLGSNKITNIDSTVIKNGAFTFSGKCFAIPMLHGLVIGQGNSATMGDFFLEGGNIKARMTVGKRAEHIYGTKSNDIYVVFKDKVNGYIGEMATEYAHMLKSTASDSMRTASRRNLDSLNNCYMEYSRQFTSQNLTNLVGIFLFGAYYQKFTAAQDEQLLAKVPAYFKQLPSIVLIRKYVAQKMLTAPGKPFIDLTMQTPEGTTAKLSDYVGKGKYILLNVWAAWDVQSISDMATVTKEYNLYKDKNFDIVSVSLDKNAETWKKMIGTLKMKWPQMSDLKQWNSDIVKQYGIEAIPSSILIGPDGKIIAKDLRGNTLTDKLAETFR